MRGGHERCKDIHDDNDLKNPWCSLLSLEIRHLYHEKYNGFFEKKK